MKFIIKCKLWQCMTPFLYLELTTTTGRSIYFIIHKWHTNWIVTRNENGIRFEFIIGKYVYKTIRNFINSKCYQNPTI